MCDLTFSDARSPTGVKESLSGVAVSLEASEANPALYLSSFYRLPALLALSLKAHPSTSSPPTHTPPF